MDKKSLIILGIGAIALYAYWRYNKNKKAEAEAEAKKKAAAAAATTPTSKPMSIAVGEPSATTGSKGEIVAAQEAVSKAPSVLAGQNAV